MKVYFSYGKESSPWGYKIKRRASISKELGFDVDSIDYTDTHDPDQRVKRLVSILEREDDKCILVGSSMGGYVLSAKVLDQKLGGQKTISLSTLLKLNPEKASYGEIGETVKQQAARR